MSDVVQVTDEQQQRRKLKGKSRVTNGKQFLPQTDGRSIIARRYRDIARAIQIEQGDDISETRLQLVRRFSAAAVLAEQIEARLANGEEINIVEHCQLASTMVRIAHRIGIDRIAKEITPSLDEYLAQNHPEPAAK